MAFASESLRKYFGPEVFNHTGVVNLKFLRPVKDGDTITITGSIIQREPVEKRHQGHRRGPVSQPERRRHGGGAGHGDSPVGFHQKVKENHARSRARKGRS